MEVPTEKRLSYSITQRLSFSCDPVRSCEYLPCGIFISPTLSARCPTLLASIETVIRIRNLRYRWHLHELAFSGASFPEQRFKVPLSTCHRPSQARII